MRIGSLFSGIGGLELGLERAGLGHVVWQCEIDPFCRRVLARHWPNAVRYEDVKEIGDGLPSVDVLCGGFPCQDVSQAGRQAGLEGARSGLWYEYLRIIEATAPKIVVIENVLGLRTRGLRDVLGGLAALGFDACWTCVAAADVGAPHLRKRLFIVASHPERVEVRDLEQRLSGSCEGREVRAGGEGVALHDGGAGGAWRSGPAVAPVRRVDDGIPDGSHAARLKALGNAVVPQCAEVVGLAIKESIVCAK